MKEGSSMNIYQKLLEVRKMVPYLKKESASHQYKYVGSSQVIAAVRAKMDELGLLLIPEVVAHKVTAETSDKGKTNYFTELDMNFTWVNVDKPEETITKPWYAQGVDIAGEKGVGKAMTYSEKTFLLKFFNIATDEMDPDAFQERMDNLKPINKGERPADKAKMGAITTMVRKAQLTKEAYTQLVIDTLGHDRYTELTSDEADKMIGVLSHYKPQEVAQ